MSHRFVIVTLPWFSTTILVDKQGHMEIQRSMGTIFLISLTFCACYIDRCSLTNVQSREKIVNCYQRLAVFVPLFVHLFLGHTFTV